MFTVQAINRQTGEIIPRFRAEEVTVQTRTALKDLYNYTCLNDDCAATFHWRKAVRSKGNQFLQRETFVTNKTAPHTEGCRYDYRAFADANSDIVYVEDDRLHVRINFPLGGARTDLYPPRLDLKTVFNSAANNAQPHVKKTSIDSLRHLTDFLEEKFGSFENAVMSDIDFDYQGQTYKWDDLFIASDHYKKLYHAAYDPRLNVDTKPALVVIKPVREAKPASGRPKFFCETQYAKPERRTVTIEPVLVCENEEMAQHIRKITQAGGTLLIATRPYPAQNYRDFNRVPVYLHARTTEQLARIDGEKYWRIVPGPRHQMTFMDEFSPAR